MLTNKFYYVPLWMWITFGLLLCLSCFYLFVQYKAPKILSVPEIKKEDTTTLEYILKNAQNGDIILTSGDTKGEKTCRWCTGSVFSHVGFLFREVHPKTHEDIVYIFDCDLGQGTKDGVRVMPLRDKLHRYGGFRVGAWKKLLSQNRPTTEKILELVPKYLPLEFDDKILTWWVAKKGEQGALYHFLKNQQKVFCSELVASILQSLHILKKDRVPAWYCPGYFHENRLFLEKDYSYGRSLFFDFQKSHTQKIIDDTLSVTTGMGEVNLQNQVALST